MGGPDRGEDCVGWDPMIRGLVGCSLMACRNGGSSAASCGTSQLPPDDVYVPAAAPLAASDALRQTTPVASSGCQMGRREGSSAGTSETTGAGVAGAASDGATDPSATRRPRSSTYPMSPRNAMSVSPPIDSRIRESDPSPAASSDTTRNTRPTMAPTHSRSEAPSVSCRACLLDPHQHLFLWGNIAMKGVEAAFAGRVGVADFNVN